MNIYIFWIQIKCPDLVRLWRIALRGRESNTERVTERIHKWKLEGSTDGNTYTVLYESSSRTFIGDEMQHFPTETNDNFNIFRLFCLEAEEGRPGAGLSYMQLFVYTD